MTEPGPCGMNALCNGNRLPLDGHAENRFQATVCGKISHLFRGQSHSFSLMGCLMLNHAIVEGLLRDWAFLADFFQLFLRSV